MTIVAPRPLSELPRPLVDFYDQPLEYIAFIVENKVELILSLSPETASLFVNNQKIVQADSVENGGADKNWIYNESNNTFAMPEGYEIIPTPQEIDLPRFRILVIKDNLVQQVFYFQEREASIILSNPIIKNITSPYSGGPKLGWIYDADTNTYSEPVEILPENSEE